MAEVDIWRKTEWPRAEPDARDLCDDLLAAWREVRANPDFLPDLGGRKRWLGEARQFCAGHGYVAGFMAWALREHASRFERQGLPVIVTGPMSLDYLLDDFRRQHNPATDWMRKPCRECGCIHVPGPCYEDDA